MVEQIPKDISDKLADIFKEDIENFEILSYNPNDRGEGFLGEILYISLRHKKSKKEHHLVIKKSLDSDADDLNNLISSSFSAEIYFYTKIMPEYRKFQESFPGAVLFDNIPKCYGVSLEKGKEMIVLDNLKYQKYEMHQKKLPVTFEMYEAIFKMYGTLHGTSMAFKHHHPEKFWEMANSLPKNLFEFSKTDLFAKSIENGCSLLKSFLDESGETDISIKFNKYVKDGVKAFQSVVLNESPFGIIVHGDSWSNNMMFKYDKSRNVEDIKLLDFQMTTLGTPVMDLSYALYSGASKDTLAKFDILLKIYYNSLSETLNKFNCDVQQIITYEELRKEFKENIGFGLMAALIVWSIKTSEPDEMINMASSQGDAGLFIKSNQKNFRNEMLNVVKHLYENHFL